MIVKLYKLYLNSPLWLKRFVSIWYNLIPSKYKYGVKFNDKLLELNQQEYITKEEVKKMQDEKFLKLVKYCYEYVPYYKKTFDELNIDIDRFTGIEDINKIPFLTKDIVRDNFEDFISKSVNKEDLKYITTGGTSGRPFGFYVDYDSDLIEWAYVTNLWGRVGYNNESTRLVMRGKTFENMKRGIPWQYDPIKKEISISIFDMNESNLKLYIDVINKYKPHFIHGYPSAIEILCKYIRDNEIQLTFNFRAILTVSENLYDHQRELMEKVFKTRVFSFYGHSERLIMAGECEVSKEYHINPSYGYAEIIDKNGEQIKDNRAGELVGTGFNNFGMPFIRYKTGDIARWSQDNKCNCGRSFDKIEKIEGRWNQEILVKKDGTRVSITSLNMHSDILDNVKKFQLYQEKYGEVIIKIIKGDNFKDIDKDRIINGFKEKTKSGILYKIEFVNEIENKKNGKFIFVDQRLDLK